MTRFLVDAQLPPALARWLTEKGHRADHVSDLGLATATDLAIWNVARDLEAAIITKDKDFVQLRALSSEGPSIVWVRLTNTARNVLISWFEKTLPHVISALDRGETLIEMA